MKIGTIVKHEDKVGIIKECPLSGEQNEFKIATDDEELFLYAGDFKLVELADLHGYEKSTIIRLLQNAINTYVP